MAAPAAAAAAVAADAAPKGAPLFVKLDNTSAVDWATQVVINAKGKNKKLWDEAKDKYFVLRDPLANYKEGQEQPPPLPPLEPDENVPDYFVAFPRAKFCEVSEHVKRLVDVFEQSGEHRPIVIAEITPEAVNLLAEFMKSHLTDKLREIPKPMRDHVKSYLTQADQAWVTKWINFDNVYENWLLFRMVDAAEVLMYEDFSTIVAAVLGECLKDKKISELRRFFHETDPHGGFTAEEERTLYRQCRESWPESKHLFDVAPDEDGAPAAASADAAKK